MPCPTRRRRGCPVASGTLGSRPSRGWRWSWSRPPSRPASGSGRWWPTASTATTPASPMPWGPPGCGSCWPQASQGHLGAGRGGPPPGRGGRRPRLAGIQQARPVAAGDPPLPRRPHRDLGAADAQLGGWGPDRPLRLVVASTDPARLPGHSSWYLLTNLPRPATRRAQQTDLAEIVRLYGLRNWVEQGDKQVKGELGWADFQVRSDRAIRRHWTLVCCAFSFCWQAFFADHPTQPAAPDPPAVPSAARGAEATRHRGRTGRQELLARGPTGGAGLAGPLDRAATLLAIVVASAPAPAAPTAA